MRSRTITPEQKARTRLTLSSAERRQALELGREILRLGGSEARWDAADRTPAFAAAVRQVVAHGRIGSCQCHDFSPRVELEQFYRFGEATPDHPQGIRRGGIVWVRPRGRRARRSRR